MGLHHGAVDGQSPSVLAGGGVGPDEGVGEGDVGVEVQDEEAGVELEEDGERGGGGAEEAVVVGGRVGDDVSAVDGGGGSVGGEGGTGSTYESGL